MVMVGRGRGSHALLYVSINLVGHCLPEERGAQHLHIFPAILEAETVDTPKQTQRCEDVEH